MLFSKQSLMAVCLSLLGISSTTTAIRSSYNYSTDHQKEEAAYAGSRVNGSPLRIPRELSSSSGKKGKGKGYVPPPPQCFDLDLDSILLVQVSADIMELANDAGQRNALEELIVEEYNELAVESCGEGVRLLESGDISFGEDALATRRRRLLEQLSHAKKHQSRRLESTRPPPDGTLPVTVAGKCNTCKNNNVLQKDTSNRRYLSFLEDMETTATSNIPVSSSDHSHQRRATEGRKHGERSGQVADTTMFGTSGKKMSSKSSVSDTSMDSAASGKKSSSSKSPSGKKGDDSSKGKKDASNDSASSGKKMSSKSSVSDTSMDSAASGKKSSSSGKKGEDSMKGKKDTSNDSASSGKKMSSKSSVSDTSMDSAASGKKSSSSGKKGKDSSKGKKDTSMDSAASGKKSSSKGPSGKKDEDSANAPSGKKASMDDASYDSPSESYASYASSDTSSSGKKGKKSKSSSGSPDESSSGKKGKGKGKGAPEECCEPPTDADLSAALREALQEDPNAVPSVSDVGNIVELKPVDCSAEVTTLHGVVTIEHEASHIKDNELHLLAEAFVDAYNQANSLSVDICDPSFRAVTDVTVQEPYVPPAGKGKGKGGKTYAPTASPSPNVLEYYYTATCRGCEEGSKIFESTSAGRSLENYGNASRKRAPVYAGDHRQLAETIQAKCFCPPAPPAESRGPSTSEFYDIFADLFDFLRVEGDINYIETVGAISEH